MSENPTNFPPPGITQSEWHELTPAERAEIVYSGEPASFEDDMDVERFRWNSR